MSAYKWLKFAVGIPLAAILIAVVYSFTSPATDVMRDYSTSPESSAGITWYSDILQWLPLVVLMLLAFMVVVAIITRRRRVAP